MNTFMREQAEPFEESQGAAPVTASRATADALKAYYADMERKELADKKLARGKSSGRSLWSRKSTKKAPAPAAPHDDDDSDAADGRELDEQQQEGNDQVSSVMLSRSIIPDPLGELPAWFHKEYDLPSSPSLSYRMRYPIHNPVGPRWYRNYHLIPTSQLRPASRPPSVFSPSFPPMTSSLVEPSEDSTRLTGPSRTPSGSPLPTPDSSQSGLPDGGKVRTRKTSQTAHDGVDLLDGTDPWGTNWHHQSPYDPGLASNPVSFDVPDPSQPPRPRGASMSQVRRRTVTPSPLSQSTSAVHLHVQEAEQAHIPRKLSKRRKPVVSGIFSGPEGSVSAPTTPYDRHNPADRSSVISPASLNAPSVIPSHLSSEKKEKRGSVLGRLAKKFSLLRKPQHGPSPSGDEWQHVDGAGRESRQSRVEPSAQKPELHTQRSADPPRRVPAPSVDNEQATIAAPASVDRPGHPSDDTSSLEAPFTIGKLTVANPDAPSSYGGSPDLPEAPLPPDDVAHMPTMSEEPLPLATSPEPMSPALPHASNGASKADHRVSADATPRREDKRMSSAHDRHARTSTAPSAASVPFPSGAPPLSPPDPARFSAATSAYTEGSPLSEVSVMANPPTPYVPPAPIPEAPAPAPQPPAPAPSPEKRSARKSSPQKRHSEAPEAPKLQMPTPLIDAPAPQSHASPREERHSSRDTSPAKPSKPEVPPKDARAKAPSSVTSRETETFRLVRSPSGGMMPSGATITAGGEQWQIVGSEGPRRSKTKEGGAKSKDRSKDRDSPMSKDRDDTKSKDRDSTMSKERESGSRREHKRQDKGEGESRSRTKSQVRPKLATVPVAEHSSSSMQSSSKASRGRSLDRSDADQAHHRLKENGSAPANIDKPQPPPPAPTPAPGPRTNLERRSSKNARPSSELVPTAELNTMRARETWEMDRLWKGRSMYNENGIAIGPVPSPPANGELARDDSTIRSAGHGSSHTSFMVQSPFQGQYSSSSSANAYRATSPQDYFYPHDSQDAVSPPLSNNPLPDPPRPSPYQPAPLPPPLSESHEVHNAEYWTKYAGLTAAH